MVSRAPILLPLLLKRYPDTNPSFSAYCFGAEIGDWHRIPPQSAFAFSQCAAFCIHLPSSRSAIGSEGTQGIYRNFLIQNSFPKWGVRRPPVYHFGSANAKSSCNEEAVPFGTLHSSSDFSPARFFPGNDVQMSYL